MRIDGTSAAPPAGLQPVAREVKPTPVHQPPAVITDRVDTHPTAPVSPTNVLVEMQPGNIVVYKFIDEASGRLIQQIPAEQLLNLSRLDEAKTGEAAKEKKRS